MTATAILLILAILPVQFSLARSSALFEFSETATLAAAVGLAIYYVAGPFTVPRSVRTSEGMRDGSV